MQISMNNVLIYSFSLNLKWFYRWIKYSPINFINVNFLIKQKQSMKISYEMNLFILFFPVHIGEKILFLTFCNKWRASKKKSSFSLFQGFQRSLSILTCHQLNEFCHTIGLWATRAVRSSTILWWQMWYFLVFTLCMLNRSSFHLNIFIIELKILLIFWEL